MHEIASGCQCQRVAERKGGPEALAQFHDKKGDVKPSSRKAQRLLLRMSREFGRSDNASIVL